MASARGRRKILRLYISDVIGRADAVVFIVFIVVVFKKVVQVVVVVFVLY